MPSNLSRRAQRKKQTRLAFDPVAHSSSATMSPAPVRYDILSPQPKTFDFTSPELQAHDELTDAPLSGEKYAVDLGTSKRQKKNGKIPFKPLVTPVGSSQTQVENAMSTVSSEADTSDSDLDVVSASRRQRMPRSAVAPIFMSGHQKRRTMSYDGAEDLSSAELSPGIPEQIRLKKTKSGKARAKEIAVKSVTPPIENTGDESPLESPVRASVKRGQVVLRKSQSESQVKIDEPTAKATRSFTAGGNNYYAPINKKFTPTKPRRGSSNPTPKSSNAKKKQITTLSDDDDDDAPNTPRRTARVDAHQKQTPTNEESDDALPDLPNLLSSTAKKSTNTVTFAEPIKLDSEEDSEDVITRSSPKLRRSTYAEEDEEPVLSSPKKRRRPTVPDDSGTDELASPPKRLRQGTRKRVDMKESDAKRITTRKQQRKKPHRSEREKQLELLKRQRAGEKITDLTSSDSDEVQAQALYDSDSELEVLSEFEDEEEDDDRLQLVRESLRPLDRTNDDDDDFVVDEDEPPLGVPGYGLNDIPLEFTHQAHKRLIEHFKDAIEWMVQNKLNPGFNRDDPIYVQAFKKVDVEVRGYADSKYISASWKAPFIRALNARPEFYVEALGPGDENQGRKCDACGRTNHPATFQVQFGGKAYYKDTLDEIDNDHDEDEDEDEDDASVNSDGEIIPDVKTSWYVGRFCKGNAETAHRLKHWKFALNEWVIGTLKSEGHLEPQKLAQREDWSKKKRSEYANGIVDDWWENKEIKGLYRDFKNNLEAAREGKTGRWRNQ